MFESHNGSIARVVQRRKAAKQVACRCLCLVIGFAVLPGCRKEYEPPPDVSRCTRLEVYRDWASMQADLQDMGISRAFLSPDEIRELRSSEKTVIDDKRTIREIAHAVSSGSHTTGASTGMPLRLKGGFEVTCYHASKQVGRFRYDVSWVKTPERVFLYAKPLPSLWSFYPERIQPLLQRIWCGMNLSFLWDYFYGDTYPRAEEWCDSALEDLEESGSLLAAANEILKCPSEREGRCHYAMNPNCKPNSPPDTVLLFETKAGWNQYGGAELFTFDNHDPKGGCVLLNDGTVKFIRTKEELAQLRWKPQH